MGQQPEVEVEVFPPIPPHQWKLASGEPLTNEIKEKCSDWTVEIRYRDGKKGLVHAYFHGDLPSDADRLSLNRQIAEFFNASVAHTHE
jgi:hypothetical protein